MPPHVCLELQRLIGHASCCDRSAHAGRGPAYIKSSCKLGRKTAFCDVLAAPHNCEKGSLMLANASYHDCQCTPFPSSARVQYVQH